MCSFLFYSVCVCVQSRDGTIRKGNFFECGALLSLTRSHSQNYESSLSA